ncbi:hypothetical protein J3Q64DRAFT_1847833 [Phycomyces blakesleeanus]|uniref:Uncharacterized protein n=1 Tax=Phycomyces blakesleeanus TaxID=4837 RepID=A0ABR3B1S7_PHYBL
MRTLLVYSTHHTISASLSNTHFFIPSHLCFLFIFSRLFSLSLSPNSIRLYNVHSNQPNSVLYIFRAISILKNRLNFTAKSTLYNQTR